MILMIVEWYEYTPLKGLGKYFYNSTANYTTLRVSHIILNCLWKNSELDTYNSLFIYIYIKYNSRQKMCKL